MRENAYRRIVLFMNTTLTNTYSNNSTAAPRTMAESVKPGDAIYTRKTPTERLTVLVVSDNLDGAVLVCEAIDGRHPVVLQREVLAHFVADCNRVPAGAQGSLL